MTPFHSLPTDFLNVSAAADPGADDCNGHDPHASPGPEAAPSVPGPDPSIPRPEDLAGLHRRTLADYRDHFLPRDCLEDELVALLAMAAVRLRQAPWHEAALHLHEARRARACWDDDRALAAEELAAGLAQRPGVVRRKLARTKQGCELLIGRWEALARILEQTGGWDEAQRSLALDLLGVAPALRAGRTAVDPGDGDEALAVRGAVVSRELGRLRGLLAGRLEQQDVSEQIQAERGHPAEPSAAMKQLRRSAAASERTWWRALQGLTQLRQGDESDRAVAAAAARPAGAGAAAEPKPKLSPAEALDRRAARARDGYVRLERALGGGPPSGEGPGGLERVVAAPATADQGSHEFRNGADGAVPSSASRERRQARRARDKAARKAARRHR